MRLPEARDELIEPGRCRRFGKSVRQEFGVDRLFVGGDDDDERIAVISEPFSALFEQGLPSDEVGIGEWIKSSVGEEFFILGIEKPAVFADDDSVVDVRAHAAMEFADGDAADEGVSEAEMVAVEDRESVGEGFQIGEVAWQGRGLGEVAILVGLGEVPVKRGSSERQ